MADMDQNKLIEKIARLKQERRAVILAHNYELAEVQDIADFTGDSLELSIRAAETEAGVIVFCGVTFMAETAKILSPSKTVLLPVLAAGCPMADMANAAELRDLKARHPGAEVVTYVNSTAEVKAESDICVTSANAEKIVSRIPVGKEILFVPDRNLGQNIINRTGRRMILWPGFCPTHRRIENAELERRKREFPNAVVLAHPECNPEIAPLVDEFLSTGGICAYARKSLAKEFIIVTEIGILHRLQKENPGKVFIPASVQAVCPFMKLIRLEDVLRSLENMEYKVELPRELMDRARIPIRRMLEMSK
ncbi:MAG: Quinolinate synthase A [Lentisphaerae bacterium ADurb.Bin242]|nr:MAG: Quinolinate synthase A [Lentisphaerae bacterium ADurb.Bin242]